MDSRARVFRPGQIDRLLQESQKRRALEEKQCYSRRQLKIALEHLRGQLPELFAEHDLIQDAVAVNFMGSWHHAETPREADKVINRFLASNRAVQSTLYKNIRGLLDRLELSYEDQNAWVVAQK